MTNNQLDRFLAKVYLASNGCWEWTAYRNRLGYGVFCVSKREKRTTMAHRLSYEYFVGDVPAEHEMDHLCRNPSCVNPTHLEAVTHSVNVQRGLAGDLMPSDRRIVKAGNAVKRGFGIKPEWREIARAAVATTKAERTCCGHGHPWTPDNTYLNPAGKRYCRACLYANQARLRARRRVSKPARTHCCHGHEWTLANTYASPARPHYLCCRECKRTKRSNAEQAA